MAMNRTLFYNELRKAKSGVFGTALKNTQVAGLEADLDEAERRGLPLEQVAAILAEDYHETGHTMQPVTENLNYTTVSRIRAVWPSRFKSNASAQPYVRQPEKLANFVYGGRNGNTKPGDGWRYRGRGKSQITFYDNYKKFGIEDNPEQALDLKTAVTILFDGILLGKFTGKKLSAYVGNGKKDYRGSRATVNSDVKANGDDIAKYALAFEKALRVAGYGSSAVKAPVQPTTPGKPKPAPVPTPVANTNRIYTDSVTVEIVQRRLYELGYTEVGSRRPDGTFDGKIGSMTRGAILLFRNDNGLNVSDAIDTELLEALDTASPRKLARNDASPATVRQNAPEVQSNFFNKILAGASAGGIGVYGIADQLLEKISPWKSLLDDIPGYVWLGLGLAICGVVYWISSRGEQKGVEAYQSGERR